MNFHDLRQCLDVNGLIGPFNLSLSSRDVLHLLIAALPQDNNLRNLHVSLPLVRQVITDNAIVDLVEELFDDSYQLWRTNFFRRHLGSPHPGVALHHDKHFQNAHASIDFDELGDHLSIVIALDVIDRRNGCFTYLPGSHRSYLPGMVRDTRPFELRPLEDHFPVVPSELLDQLHELPLPGGSFCLFHSALLHGSRPSNGDAGRTSMVARLVNRQCCIPSASAQPHEILRYC